MRNSPSVHFPPPLLFVLGFAFAWLLHRRWPLALLQNPSAVSVSFGWLLISAGLALLAAGLLTFLRHRTGIYPNQPATTMVMNGPYRFTRNPMYVALTTLYLGIALLLNMLWALLLLPVVIVVLQLAVIRREERYLKEKFGEAYMDYCRRVRRWL